MIFCKSRERIILDRIDKLEKELYVETVMLNTYADLMPYTLMPTYKLECYYRAINRMYKLIKK